MIQKTKKAINYLSLSSITIISTLIIAPYIGSMIIIPAIKSGWSWKYIHAVWLEWQTLNAGMIAIIASLIALGTTAYKEEKQRERNLRASKAFLPHSLSWLCAYCENNIRALHSTLKGSGHNPAVSPLTFKPTEIDDDVFITFSDCIRYADSTDGEFLANLVGKFQIIRARLNFYTKKDRSTIITATNIYSDIQILGEARVLIDNSFEYARDEGELLLTPVDGNAIKKILLFQCEIHRIDDGLKEYLNRR